MPKIQNDQNYMLPLFLLLLPYYVVAQDSFNGNSGEPFTPSTIIILIMAVIFVMTAFLAIFLRQFSQGCFGLNVAPTNPNVTADGRPIVRGLDAEVIKSLPTYFYSDVKQHRKGKVELECAVCLSEFLDAEALRLLPGCSHVFHPRCIDAWLVAHVTCPICRQSLEPQSGITKDHSIINLPLSQDEPNGHDQPTQYDNDDDEHQSDEHDDDDDYEEVTKKSIVGKFPRSHSTGHSMANSERFTLKLPEEVHNTLVNRSSYAGEPLTSMLSPRGGSRFRWFSTTPPANLVIGGTKKVSLPPVKTSECFWPI